MADHQKIHPVAHDVEAPAAPTAPLVARGVSKSDQGDPAVVGQGHYPPFQRTIPVMHSKPPKKRSCCCKCLCWTISLLLLLVILIAATVGILFLVFRPKLPKFSVDKLEITQFNLSNSDDTLNATFDVTITATNPNKKIGIYYEGGSQISGWYQNTQLCEGALPKFYQGHKNTTVLNLALTGQTQNATGLISALSQQRQETGNIPLGLKVNQPVKVKLGSLKLFKVKFRVRCTLLNIPYPFGTKEGCYLEESFLIICNDTHFNPPIPFLGNGTLQVLNISLDGELRVSTTVARNCYDKSGLNFENYSLFESPNFPISHERNIFTAVGCDTAALIGNIDGKNYTTGCLSLCDNIESVDDGSCSGIGCCQTPIPKGVTDFIVVLVSLDNHSKVLEFNPCEIGFVVEENAYNFSSLDLTNFKYDTVPVVLDWAVGNETCLDARRNSVSYACKAENSTCYESNNSPGYRCNCSSGFQGNPYLLHGCYDINECENSNPCDKECHNIPGSFYCNCPKGYEGDGLKNGTGCRAKVSQSKLIIITLSISVGLLVLLVGGSWIYWGLKKRKLIKLKEKFFQQNGGLLLQQKLSSHNGSMETARIYSAEELENATNNYDEKRVLGQGGYGTVYRGILPDNKVIAIKKSKIGSQSQVEQFVNEITVLTQIIHRNVVKLLGCCLETEVPLLVYEFITNGTLSEHIHDNGRSLILSWEKRLKIAAETAGALAYLHSATSVPIIHRDVKTANILLDDNFTAKVSDFGASRLIPFDKTELNTLVQGTFGYMDPEYFHTSQLTEKSDVYSFGVVLAELLTGRMALSFNVPESDRNLAKYFVSAIKEDRLLQILEDNIVNEGNIKLLKEVANIAKRCLNVRGEDRPSMKEVAMELEGLVIMEKHPWGNANVYTEETEYLLSAPTQSFNIDVDTNCSTGTTTGYDSMINQVLKPLDGGR